jgi:dGTPase
MDWADDITFAVHDLMDFYQAGRIPLEAINSSGGQSKELSAFLDATFGRKPKYREERPRYEEALKRILEYISFEQRYEGTRHHREAVWRNSTLLISRFLEQMEITRTDGQRRLRIAKERKDEVKMLKEFTWHYVILHHDLAMQQHGQKHMLGTVLRDLLNRTGKEEYWPVFPPLIRHRLVLAKQRGESTARVVVDHVASMSDLEVSTTYRNMRGRR